MYRSSEVVSDAGSQAVVIGAGLIWDDVHAALAPFGADVLGGKSYGHRRCWLYTWRG